MATENDVQTALIEAKLALLKELADPNNLTATQVATYADAYAAIAGAPLPTATDESSPRSTYEPDDFDNDPGFA